MDDATGLYYEDFEPGQVHETGRRRLAEADLSGFAELSGDQNPLHSDDAYARARGFARRIAQGVLALAVVTGLVNQSGLTRGTLLAFLGLSWHFRMPVYAGDVIQARLRVRSKRLTRDPGRGLVVLDVVALNEAGAPVQDGEFTILVQCRATNATANDL
jgi:acyl dehydratase